MPKGLRKILSALLVAGVAGSVIFAGNRPLAVPAAGVQTPSAPGAPAQDPESNKVVDFVADRGYPIPYGDTTATVLVGHFAAQHNGAVITCDSAIRYNDKRIECFGNVLINKKETYIYGDRADYNGEINEARVYAPLVKVVDGDATLYTYDFRFNTLDNIGTFSGGGMLTNRENHLESDRGYYYADTHRIICVDRVEMRNDKYELKGDSVVYDTDTDQAHFFERTNIWNEGGDYIYADRGRYEKPRELYVLTRNGYVMTEKQELWSDSLDYYRESGHALLYRNIQIDDAEHKVLAFGDYGEYWKEPGNALLTQRPSVVSYDTSQSDSLYMCADSMFLYTISKSEQARADSLAKVKAKAAALAADSLAGSKGGSSVDSLAAKPSAAGAKVSSDGSQAGTAAPQVAAGAVEASSDVAGAGSGSAAEPIAAVPAEKGGPGTDSLDAVPAIDTLLSDGFVARVGTGMPPADSVVAVPAVDTLLSDSLAREEAGMPPADSVVAVPAVNTLFPDSLAQAGVKSLPADSSVHILSKRERKAQADSLKAQLRAQADSVASVKKAQAAAARKEKLAQIAKARQARATAKLDAAKQKEEALRRKNLERRAERMEKIWAKRRAKTGKAILKGKLPASALDSLVADSLREARAFAALDSLFRDSLAADSLGRDSMQLDSLKAGVAAADSLRGDSIAAPAGDSLYRLVKGYRRVKIFRNDFQAVCDSLVAVSTDSMILLYIDPVLWNQDNQITSDVMKIYTENSKLQKAEFVGRPVMSSEIDTMTYNQVTGKLITAYFRDNKIYRNDVDGNVQTIYYMQEDDSPEPVGLVSIQSGAATYYIDNNTVEGITYRNQPVFSIFPMDKIPETQALFLEDFKWEGHRRPALREVFDRTIRPSERAEKSALPRPDFPITRRIEEYKKLLIESGTWVDRGDRLPPEALEWPHWVGY
ncbi:OstA-like protein [Alistipes putredinis]|uniref:OstA-like protein n=1 Tax=Alistipes putredinis TaxID=28117 RepID=UPI0024B22D06|nr:OstA-like protein [Alistipes putredinis]